MLRRVHRIAALGAAGTLMATGLVALSATSAVAGTPKETGCPSGALLLSVSDLLDQGYNPDFVLSVDANADGFICGKACLCSRTDSDLRRNRRLHCPDHLPCRRQQPHEGTLTSDGQSRVAAGRFDAGRPRNELADVRTGASSGDRDAS